MNPFSNNYKSQCLWRHLKGENFDLRTEQRRGLIRRVGIKNPKIDANPVEFDRNWCNPDEKVYNFWRINEIV